MYFVSVCIDDIVYIVTDNTVTLYIVIILSWIKYEFLLKFLYLAYLNLEIMSMGESNTVVSAYTSYRHLQQYCSHPLMCTCVLNCIEWCLTPLSTVFQSYHGDSSHYSGLSCVSPGLDWALKCLAEGHSHENHQRIKRGSDPGPLDYESNTSLLSHAGPCVHV